MDVLLCFKSTAKIDGKKPPLRSELRYNIKPTETLLSS